MAQLPSRSIRISINVYSVLLLAYPPAHRQAYGPWMRQLFRDLCREAAAQDGFPGLARLWIRTLPDLAASAAAAYCEAAEEVLMLVNHNVTPLPWGSVALVVAPGLLFGIARITGAAGLLAGLSFLLVAVLAAGALAVQRRFPAWGLLALGLLTSFALLWLGLMLPGELAGRLLRLDLPAAQALGRHLLVSANLQQWITGIPVWLAIIWLLWKYRQTWRPAARVILLSGLVIAGAALLLDASVLVYAGLLLLPAALGLPLARRYGTLAALFVLGAFSYLVLFDSDYYSGYLLHTQPFYPLYVLALVWMWVGVAPLLLLRAQTLRGRAAGLLAPVLLWGAARVAVPLLVHPDFHPLSIWLNEALLSAAVLFILALAFYLYAQPGAAPTPPEDVPVGQAVFSG